MHKRVFIAASVTLALGAGAAGTAHAGAKAQSLFEVSNFVFLDNPGGSLLGAGGFNSTSGSNSGDGGAAFNGPVMDPNDLVPIGQPIDLTEFCQGPGCPGDGDDVYADMAPLATTRRAFLDADITGSALVAGGALAQTQAIAETTQAGDTGSAISELGLNFNFDLAQNTNFTIEFTGDLLLTALNNDDAVSPTSSETSISWSVSIEDIDGGSGGGTIFDWAPDGVANNIGGTGTDNSDPFSLNTQGNRNAPVLNGSAFINSQAGSFSASIPLVADNTYQLVLTHIGRTDVTKAGGVPEPGVVALMATGLLGMGWAGRQKGRKAA